MKHDGSLTDDYWPKTELNQTSKTIPSARKVFLKAAVLGTSCAAAIFSLAGINSAFELRAEDMTAFTRGALGMFSTATLGLSGYIGAKTFKDLAAYPASSQPTIAGGAALGAMGTAFCVLTAGMALSDKIYNVLQSVPS